MALISVCEHEARECHGVNKDTASCGDPHAWCTLAVHELPQEQMDQIQYNSPQMNTVIHAGQSLSYPKTERLHCKLKKAAIKNLRLES